MHSYKRPRTPGFTLIELLVVVGIIVLLVGIIVPAIGAAKNHARTVATKNLLATLEKGCEQYHGELDDYPVSFANNPFEAGNVRLSGAQWLIFELAGADLQGQILLDKHRQYDANTDSTINHQDFQIIYDATSAWRQNFTPHRFGPYIEVDSKVIQTPDQYGGALPPALDPLNSAAGSSNWNNGKLPFAVDAWGYPVLYYRANEHARHPFATALPPVADVDLLGVYSQMDNAAFTGSAVTGDEGLNLGAGAVAGASQYHWLYDIGWDANTPTTRPLDKTFASAVYDREVFDQQAGTGNTGNVRPRRPNSFILISPGKDAIWGTGDDVTNF